MSDQMLEQQREEYLTLIVGYLTEQYVHTHDPETKAAIEELRVEIEEIKKRQLILDR